MRHRDRDTLDSRQWAQMIYLLDHRKQRFPCRDPLHMNKIRGRNKLPKGDIHYSFLNPEYRSICVKGDSDKIASNDSDTMNTQSPTLCSNRKLAVLGTSRRDFLRVFMLLRQFGTITVTVCLTRMCQLIGFRQVRQVQSLDESFDWIAAVWNSDSLSHENMTIDNKTPEIRSM